MLYELSEILKAKLDQYLVEQISYSFNLTEAASIKIVTRVRNGKVQRRVRVSGKKGYRVVGGRLKRMSPQEQRNRKRAARRAARKIRMKAKQAARKRARSMRKRKSLGA